MAESDRRVVGVMTEQVHGHAHIAGLRLADGADVSAGEAMGHIEDAEFVYTMIPPPHAPAYEAYVQTGLPLLVQVRQCPDCSERVLFA